MLGQEPVDVGSISGEGCRAQLPVAHDDLGSSSTVVATDTSEIRNLRRFVADRIRRENPSTSTSPSIASSSSSIERSGELGTRCAGGTRCPAVRTLGPEAQDREKRQARPFALTRIQAGFVMPGRAIRTRQRGCGCTGASFSVQHRRSVPLSRHGRARSLRGCRSCARRTRRRRSRR